MTNVVYAVEPLDPLGDLEADGAQQATRNRAKVGSARPTSLLYTYGPGAIMDLPNFTVMPAGLDDWDRIWARRTSIPTIHAPRLLDTVRRFPGQWFVKELRPFPWAPKENWSSKEGEDLGIPARVFPQWLRCTGCDMLGPIRKFSYVNTNPYRPDKAKFEHPQCPGRYGKVSRRPQQAVPARFLLACQNGHLDEFPYDWWVHYGRPCPSGAEAPTLKMTERAGGRGASATIVCGQCDAKRPMSQAQGEAGKTRLPQCRGRFPHLGLFARPGGKNCNSEAKLMIVGASNLWFPATQSIVVMPELHAEEQSTLGLQLLDTLTMEAVEECRGDLDELRKYLRFARSPLAEWPDPRLATAVGQALDPEPTFEQQAADLRQWDPVDLLVPEWTYLQNDPREPQQKADDKSGLVLSTQSVHPDLADRHVARVLSVDKLRKVNAVVGFTRIDEMERAGDLVDRIVPLSRSKQATWAVATEDRGEGIFLQLDEDAVASWEQRVYDTPLWGALRAAHRTNFENRFSDTAKNVDPDQRLPPPRYWLVHTLSHVLLRGMAMYSGYSAASLSERLYAWEADGDRPAAAGLMIVTTASDSDGTLGGLVQLARERDLRRVMERALERARRCSSDPVCAHRTPRPPEDFLHGAACHTCAMASETSCERANRFLDRRFLIPLPEHQDYAFFR